VPTFYTYLERYRQAASSFAAVVGKLRAAAHAGTVARHSLGLNMSSARRLSLQ
jgi:hypothetical protein